MHAYEFLLRYGPAAVVTDAATGLGEAFAALLAKGGFDLVLAGGEAARLEPLAARLRDHEGVNITVCPGDVAVPAFAEAVVSSCRELDIGLLVSRTPATLLAPLLSDLLSREHAGLILTEPPLPATEAAKLWRQLQAQGIDVLALAAVATDTSPRQLAQAAVDRITDGPVLDATFSG